MRCEAVFGLLVCFPSSWLTTSVPLQLVFYTQAIEEEPHDCVLPG